MRVVVAPDGFGGSLSAPEAADAVVAGWRRARPDDEVVARPLSDGGEGLLEVLAPLGGELRRQEVAGPQGHPVEAAWLLRDDGTAVIESALACGLALVPAERRSPMPATTYGVGQLVDAARRAGARRILVGLGGSATVDGGAGALGGLGFHLRTADGSGLKVGAAELHRIDRVEPTWVGDFSGRELELWADVEVALPEAAARFGPQKGASPEQVDQLERALTRWAEVVERDLTEGRPLRDTPGTGAAGGLGFGLAAALDAPLVPGAERVAQLLGLPDALAGADVVITGEGRLDDTSGRGKVVGHVVAAAAAAGASACAVVGQLAAGADHALDAVVEASPDGPGPRPADDVAAAAARLAREIAG